MKTLLDFDLCINVFSRKQIFKHAKKRKMRYKQQSNFRIRFILYFFFLFFSIDDWDFLFEKWMFQLNRFETLRWVLQTDFSRCRRRKNWNFNSFSDRILSSRYWNRINKQQKNAKWLKLNIFRTFQETQKMNHDRFFQKIIRV